MPYTPTEAAKIIGAAPASVRNWCSNPLFQPFLSAGATPPPRQPRLLTADDLRVLHFIAAQPPGTKLEHIAERLHSGELSDADWSPPDASAPEQATAESTTLQLLPQMFASLQAQVSDKDAQLRELTAQLLEIRQEIGTLLGQMQSKDDELQHLRALLEDKLNERERNLWQRLFGRKGP